ncbi:MAG: hypothetical protein ACYSUQ_05620 [Planctomycetota bacterium]|jgi:hypothetical protein
MQLTILAASGRDGRERLTSGRHLEPKAVRAHDMNGGELRLFDE